MEPDSAGSVCARGALAAVMDRAVDARFLVVSADRRARRPHVVRTVRERQCSEGEHDTGARGNDIGAGAWIDSTQRHGHVGRDEAARAYKRRNRPGSPGLATAEWRHEPGDSGPERKQSCAHHLEHSERDELVSPRNVAPVETDKLSVIGHEFPRQNVSNTPCAGACGNREQDGRGDGDGVHGDWFTGLRQGRATTPGAHRPRQSIHAGPRPVSRHRVTHSPSTEFGTGCTTSAWRRRSASTRRDSKAR